MNNPALLHMAPATLFGFILCGMVLAAVITRAICSRWYYLSGYIEGLYQAEDAIMHNSKTAHSIIRRLLKRARETGWVKGRDAEEKA